jgi:hypothetical protein
MKVHFMILDNTGSDQEIELELPIIPRTGDEIDIEALYCNDQVFDAPPESINYSTGVVVNVWWSTISGGQGEKNPIMPFIYVESIGLYKNATKLQIEHERLKHENQ